MTAVRGTPRFSIVTAVHNVEPYLPAFTESIDRQRFDLSRLEVVAVDDGSTDGSLDVLIDWASRSRARVKVFTKPNGGQGSARNLGLHHATGEWVTFTDPDDMLDPNFLRVADQFSRRHPKLEVMSARPVVLHEARNRLDLGHPRRWQYDAGNRVADLDEEPSVFLGLSSGSLFRGDRIKARALRFDVRIRPNFEDAHFAVRFLLDLPRPQVGLLRDAMYLYRKRASGTSTLQGSMRHPGRFSDVLEFGYLDAIRLSRRADGSVPAWVQQLIVYELSWYLSDDEAIAARAVLPDDLAPRFHELLGSVLRELDPAIVRRHRSRGLAPVWVDVLAQSMRPEPWHSPYVVRTRVDRTMELRRVNYRFAGTRPGERFLIDGVPVAPAFEKTMAHRYYGRDLLHERIVWLPARGVLRVEIDGQVVPVRRSWPRIPRGRRSLPRRDRLWLFRRMPARVVRGIERRLRRWLRRAFRPVFRFIGRGWPYRGRFANAWVVMDRVDNADDNGERLFEHLRAQRPDINAWFVLDRGTPDWARLRRVAGDRLVARGSFAWKMLMLNASWLMSSHADRAIVEPREAVRMARGRTWRYAFLQHGVIKDDLSRWLNQRVIDLFVVSTADELASVAGDGTAYVFTTKETRNTGLPRFDRLLALGQAVPEEERDLLIIAPTWRTWLALPIDRETNTRGVDDQFWDSDYARNWLGLLRSEAIAEAAARRGWRIGFMPHPNFQPILRSLELPASVTPLTFEGTDVQQLYARCALLVTDYSSVAFNTAYLDRPLVYFQFDQEAMLRGAHMGRQGYFDYEDDGFGPVARDLPSAERAVVAAIEHGARPTARYRDRIAATFPQRDGGACARVVAAVEELSRPYVPPETGVESPMEDPARAPAG